MNGFKKERTNENTRSEIGAAEKNKIVFPSRTNQKVMLTLDFEDAKERWDQEIDQFKKHIYRKWVHAEEFNRKKSELKEVKVTFSVIIMRVTKTLNKMKFKVHKHPITITNEASDHSRITAFTCFSRVIENITRKK